MLVAIIFNILDYSGKTTWSCCPTALQASSKNDVKFRRTD